MGGAAILFLGAGFSRGARNLGGAQLPLGRELAEQLWPLAFPGEMFDDASSLGEIFEVARRSAGNATKKLLSDQLLVERASIPTFYRSYLALPWYKIYTLNLDNLIPMAASLFTLPRDIETISAMQSRPPTGLAAIHLNGMVGEYPNVTFSPPQYGARTAGPDPVYETLAREIYSHPIFFIGTALDEPPLWHHLALRGERPSTSELRPKSFLVSPGLPIARRAMLDRFNVKWVSMDAEQFCRTYVEPLAANVYMGSVVPQEAASNFDDVAVVRAVAAEDLPDFLLGRDPQWGDVGRGGFAVRRSCEQDVVNRVRSDDVRLLVLTGTAGTGKSTLMRRVAAVLSADGDEVHWLRLDARATVAEIRREARSYGSGDFVFIDSAQRFGARCVDLLRGIAETYGAPTVVAAMPSTSYEELEIEPAMYGVAHVNLVMPNLDDTEIAELLDALERANRLGRLAGMTYSQRVQEFRRRAHRQLLVAMLEATSGRRFEEMIDDECRALPRELALAYAVASLATVNGYSLPRDVLLAALSDFNSEGLSIVERLCRQHLLLRHEGGHLVARHAVVARQAVGYFRSADQLVEAVERLAFALASRVSEWDNTSQERRLLARLINHSSIHAASGSRQRVRELYGVLEPLLARDAHFWLQRGAYEVERGDISLAENFLGSARSLAQNDFMIETEWAYLMMRRSCERPTDFAARAWMLEAHEILLGIIAERGQTSPNTYVVLAQKTVTWCKAAELLPAERLDLLATVRGVMKSGRQWHRDNTQFASAADDVERAYLSLAIADNDS